VLETKAAKPTVKQNLAAIRMLFDWLIVGQVLAMNPAHAVRGPKGVGVQRHALTAFEFPLRDADIEQQNLVYVSSILPPRCEVIAREVGIELLKPGDITFCVLARSETNEFGRHV
jgi:pyruvoyl-dependent arginine decarboxylase (PvlArgDC)